MEKSWGKQTFKVVKTKNNQKGDKMDDFNAILLVIMSVSLVLAYKSATKLIEIKQKDAKYQYKLAKLKITKEEEDDEDGEESEFKEALPKWLQAAAEGAGINVDKLLNGDITEVQKTIPILQKVVQIAGAKGISAKEIKY